MEQSAEIKKDTEEKNIQNLKMEDQDERILRVKKLKTQFFTEEGTVKAVDSVSFDMFKDETLGLVGETGCGKSVTALSILRLVRAPGEIVDGEIYLEKENLLELSEKEMREKRGKDITMIFQDPLNSLNPVMTIGEQVGEVFLLHQKDKMKRELDEEKLERQNKIQEYKKLEQKLEEERVSEQERQEIEERIEQLKKETKQIPKMSKILRRHSADIINEVGIADATGILDRYPHELSGGMRQRIMIAMALSCNPKILIADEPTTALDVTIQAQILELMKDLKQEFQTSILLITHDLGIIAEMCDRVAVMYSGNIIEYATAKDLFKNPRHPYTKGLIAAIPSIEKRNKKLTTIRGMVPNLIYPPSGCRFHPRCDYRLEVCDKVRPTFTKIGERYFVACHLYDPEYKDSPKYEWGEKEKEKEARV